MTRPAQHTVPASADRWGAAVVVALFALAMLAMHAGRPPADLNAVWLAARALAAGMADQVYPADASVFTMRPPSGWPDLARAAGYRGDLYPYLYPPLWAALAAAASDSIGTEPLESAARLLNPLLLAATVGLAGRLAAPRMPLTAFLGIGLVLLAAVPAGYVAIGQGQPQILVAFLTVLAIERSETRHPVAAGAALALAAAIKVYPALIALIWLGLGRRRDALSFLIAGAGLAALSVGLAGWPLHTTFLRLLGVLSKTTMVTEMTLTLDSALGQVFWPGRFALVTIVSPVPADDPASAWLVMVMAKPWPWRLLSLAVMAAAVLASVRLLRRAPDRAARAFLWPMALILLSLTGPMSWTYHYLAPLAFVPAVAARLPARAALAVLLAVFAALTPALWAWLPVPAGAGVVGTLAMAGIAGLFLWLSRHDSPAPADQTRA